VGDNYILSSDPEEQTFRVSKIVKHGKFKPLSQDGSGDGQHDIALVSCLGACLNRIFLGSILGD
jgi:hypothetical protein